MRRQHTTKTGKAMRMKFSCIISGCPEGAGKWHIQIFAMFSIAKQISVCGGISMESKALVVIDIQNGIMKKYKRNHWQY